jgi:hypothetical protein
VRGITTTAFNLCCVIFVFRGVEAKTVTAASSNYADVSSAVASAARGDTVFVPARPAVVTWPGAVSLTKGIFLQGRGRDYLTIVSNNTMIYIAPDATVIANDEVIRVEGFTFDGNNAAPIHISVQGTGATATKAFNNLAIGKCTFKNSTTPSGSNGAITNFGQTRGVIYNNIFDRCNVILKNLGNDDTLEWSSGNFPFAYGSADNLFFENNTIQFSSGFSGDAAGWMETGQSGRCVVRYNTWNFANTVSPDIFDVHGFQNWPGNGQTGTMVAEYYGNTLINTTGYRWIAHRGGWGLYYNNALTGSNTGAIAMMQYGPMDGLTSGGSGCTGDVPGAAGVYETEINNTYVFNNTANGNIVNMFPWFPDGCGVSGENVGYWNYNPSFDGSAGIGRGTAVPTMNAVDNTAFWVNPNPNPSTNPSVVQAGSLYKRINNAWILYYAPYTYPHPLIGGTPGKGRPSN